MAKRPTTSKPTSKPKPAAKAPAKQTTPPVSTLAAKVMKGKKPTPKEVLSLAASVLSQDETPGQKPRPRGK